MHGRSSAVLRKVTLAGSPNQGRSTSFPGALPKRLKRRSGFTILELLTVVGVIAILLSLTLPAISSAREAARKVYCVSQLRQIGIAIHNYHDVCNRLPSGWQWERTGQSAYGWAVALLPYLEQQSAYWQVDRNRLIKDPANSIGLHVSLDAFLCPSDIYKRTFTLFNEQDGGNGGGNGGGGGGGGNGGGGGSALPDPVIPLVDLPTASYIAVFGSIESDDGLPEPLGDGAFPGARSVRFSDFSRGLSHTFFVGERTMARVPSTWLGVDYRGEDATCRLVGAAITTPNCEMCDECEFDSRHPGGVNFLWGDGRVQFVSENIDSETYRSMSRRHPSSFP